MEGSCSSFIVSQQLSSGPPSSPRLQQEDKLLSDHDAFVILSSSEDLMYWKGIFHRAEKPAELSVLPQTASALKPGQTFQSG